MNQPAPAQGPTGRTSVRCSGLTFAWQDGTTALEGLDAAIGPGRTALIGANGSGKTTLLRLIAGELAPAAGSVRITGELGYLPQNLTVRGESRVDEVLGIQRIRAALHAIEGGDPDEAHFAAVGDDWDIEERSQAVLSQLGLGHLDLDRTVAELSGGEAVLLSLAALLLARPSVLLLDEPTNNLDRQARARLYDAVRSWSGALIVVSHDRELLRWVDQIAELRQSALSWYGGNYAAYEEAVANERETAERRVRDAEAEVRKQRRDLMDAQSRQARRTAYGKKMNAQKREPAIVMGLRKRAAQESAGKQRITHEQKLEDAKKRLDEADELVRAVDEIRVDLPQTAVPRRRRVLSLCEVVTGFGPATAGEGVSLEVAGPERIALTGGNGSGKTTLLRTITGELAPRAGHIDTHVPLRHLPQRLDLLEDQLSVLDNVRRLAPEASEQHIRAQLARFLFTQSRPNQPVHTLSGGERFRATLAALLLAEPAPQLLLLDEPTNNLDLTSVAQLTSALKSYAGALLVVSHDLPFLRSVGMTRWLTLDGPDGGLTETDPP